MRDSESQFLASGISDENGREFVVSDLKVEICEFCGEKIFNIEAVREAERIQGRVGKILIRLLCNLPLHARPAPRLLEVHCQLRTSYREITKISGIFPENLLIYEMKTSWILSSPHANKSSQFHLL